MTLLGSTVVIYLLIGIGVGVAVYLSDLARSPAQRGFQTAAGLVFWPLFLPLLLQRVQARSAAPVDGPPWADELAKSIAQVESELNEALRSLHGWADEALHGHAGRLQALGRHWQAQAARIREMDRLLALPEYTVPNDAIQAERPAVRDGAATLDGLGCWADAMCQIVERLRQVRQGAHEELMDSLARVRQVAAMLHLARFTGAPPARAAELLADIEAAVERSQTATVPDETIPAAANGISIRG
jgi:hypothetical protein